MGLWDRKQGRLPADPNTPTLSRGASGNSVTALQKGLQKYATSATDPGQVNGYFGPMAEAAMKAYQQDQASTWMESSAIKRGGLSPALPGPLLPHFLDLRRCDLSSQRSGIQNCRT